MKPQKEDVKKLLKAITSELYERDEAISLALLSALAGESIFLLGLPGVGKSMVGRRLQLAFQCARSFEYLMSRFSTPDEIFGPVSISKLKDEDRYERIVEGYLPTADIVFLDEIWKAGPSIQNTLLTVLNEKVFRNGENEIPLPLKGIIAASNELPATNEGLEALWDRFLIRLIVDQIEEEEAFNAMITSTTIKSIRVNEKLQITNAQYEMLSQEIGNISVPKVVLDVISQIRSSVTAFNITEAAKFELPPIITSDRRWKKIVRLMRTSSAINDRQEVDPTDLLLAIHCLWDEPRQKEHINAIVSVAVADALIKSFKSQLSPLECSVRTLEDELAQKYGTDFAFYEGKFYDICGVNKGHTYIARELYDSLAMRVNQEVLMSSDKLAGEDFLIQLPNRISTAQRIQISKTALGVKINGREYRLRVQSDVGRATDQLYQQTIGQIIVEITELHKNYRQFLIDIKRQLAEDLFSFNHSLLVSELARFELVIKKTLRAINQ